MKLNIPQQQSKIEKVFSVLQFVLFLAIFIGLAVLIWKLFGSWWLRIPLLVVDYIVSSLILYCVFRPLAERAVRERQENGSTKSK